jgi:electron transfer flavoprotein alpha subunit
MVLILSYVDNINIRSISMQKEMNRLKYLLELKKAKRLSQKTDDVVDVEIEEKRFQTKRKMYVGKLNKQEIKAPKLETLRYYNLQFDEETKTYAMLN